jgi:hypothetical protein
MYNDDIDYARGRLVDTIIRDGDEPIMITALNYDEGDIWAQGYYLKDNEELTIPLHKLNLESCPLGYVNSQGNAVYCMRKPMRHDWRQGIRSANLEWKGSVQFRELPLKDLRNTIVGDYPDLKEVRRRLKLVRTSKVAFSRDFALGEDQAIYYKEMKVGSYEVAINLYERFKYLIEYVTEVCDAQNC